MIIHEIECRAIVSMQVADIQPTADIFTKMISHFSDLDLIPSTYEEMDGKGNMTTRLQLRSSDVDLWTINFSSNMVDIKRRNTNIHTIPFNKKTKFTEEITYILTKILQIFPRFRDQSFSNNLLFMSEYFLTELDHEEKQKSTRGLYTLGSIYSNEILPNWGQSAMIRKKIDIGEKQEECNVLAQAQQAQGKLLIESEYQSWEGIKINYIMRTLLENSAYRFGIDEISLFYQSIITMEDQLKTDFINGLGR